MSKIWNRTENKGEPPKFSLSLLAKKLCMYVYFHVHTPALSPMAVSPLAPPSLLSFFSGVLASFDRPHLFFMMVNCAAPLRR